jgi:toxin HigB-1
VAIQSFSDKATRLFFESGKVPKKAKWQAVAKVALRKLDMLDYAAKISDLKSPSSNSLEALKHDLKGLHSIRINDQWRLVFRWTDAGPEDVRIMDYHK